MSRLGKTDVSAELAKSKEKRQRIKMKKKEKHLLKQMLVEDLSSNFENREEENRNEKLHPISHYIDDKEELIRQMFEVISEKQLQKMIPPILKNYSREELQADCLIQLVGMSTKRIKAIFEGKELDSSSDSSINSDQSSYPTPMKTVKEEKKYKNAKRVVEDFTESNEKRVNVKQSLRKSDEVTNSKLPTKESDPDLIDRTAGVKVPEVGEGKTLLEILELEMRARAIRALLQQEEQPQELKNG